MYAYIYYINARRHLVRPLVWVFASTGSSARLPQTILSTEKICRRLPFFAEQIAPRYGVEHVVRSGIAVFLGGMLKA